LKKGRKLPQKEDDKLTLNPFSLSEILLEENAMASLSLNSWLVQSERSIHLKCPAGLNVRQEEYLQALKESAKELELPLNLETCSVDWADANLHQTRIRVKLESDERYGLLTGLDYIGRVAFVEQKTYLDPVSLPAKQDVNLTPVWISAGIGVAIGVIGLLSQDGTFGCIGSLAFIIGIAVAVNLYKKATTEPEKKRTAAIDKWIKDVLDLARRAEISNELNRNAQALDEAVKVAVDRLFTQRGAQMEADEKKRKTANEIQTELENRKKQGL